MVIAYVMRVSMTVMVSGITGAKLTGPVMGRGVQVNARTVTPAGKKWKESDVRIILKTAFSNA